MRWLRRDEHYVASACGNYTVTRDVRSDGQMRYCAWRRVKEAPKGESFNPPLSLGMQFRTSDAAKQACVEDLTKTQEQAA